MNPCKPKDRVHITCGFMEEYPEELKHLTSDGKHHGVDLAPKQAFKRDTFYIIAPVGGKVIRVDKWDGDKKKPYGNLVVIESSESDKRFTHYLAHLYKSYVAIGQLVKKGVLLGVMGNTGASTARHLHYEVRNLEGHHISPMPYLT